MVISGFEPALALELLHLPQSRDGPGNQQSRDGSTVSLLLHVTDVGGTATYSATGLPAGLSLNTTTGLISGTLGLSAHLTAPANVTVTATDSSFHDTQSFVWALTPRVALLNPGPQLNATGDTVSLPLTAAAQGTLTYTAVALPGGLTLNAGTGLISGTLATSAAQVAPYLVTLTASDGGAQDRVVFHWSVAALTLPDPGYQQNLDADTVSLALGAHYHGTNTLSYSGVSLPTGLTLNASTGLISGTLAANADVSSPYAVSVTVTAGTLTLSRTFGWDVENRVQFDAMFNQSNVGGDTVSLLATAYDAVSGTLTYSAAGLPSGLTMTASSGLIAGTIATTAVSSTPATITLTATDGTVSNSQTFTWLVAPLGLSNPGRQFSVQNQTVSLSLSGRTADGGGLTWSAASLPPGLTLNASTGLVSGTAPTLGVYLVAVTANEGTNSVSQSFEWDIVEVGLTNPGNRSNLEGDTVSLSLQGVSGSGGTLTYTASALPDGLTLNASTGLVTGTLQPGAADLGPYEMAVAVHDGTAGTVKQFTWTISPYVDMVALDDQNNEEGDTVSLAVEAADAGSLSLTYTVAGLPSGVSMNSTTGLISGTIGVSAAAAGPYDVTVSASDGTYSNVLYFLWNVLYPNSTAPTITNPGTQWTRAGDEVYLTLSGTDPDGNALNWSVAGLPAGLDIDPDSGVIFGVMDLAAAGPAPYAVTVTAEDGGTLTATQTFTWLAISPDLMLQSASVSFSQGEQGEPVTLASFQSTDPAGFGSLDAVIDWGDGTTDGGAIEPDDTGFSVVGSHSYAEPGSYTITVTLSSGDDFWVQTSTAEVEESSLTTQGISATGVAGEANTYTLVQFSDSDQTTTTDSYDVTIDWADGSASAGTVTEINGSFFVSGEHTYAVVGTYVPIVTITAPGGIEGTVEAEAVVGHLFVGWHAELTAATYGVANVSASITDYDVTVDWGDGDSDEGTSNQIGADVWITGSNGDLVVHGLHTYAQPGAYEVTVTLIGPDTFLETTKIVSVVDVLKGVGSRIQVDPDEEFSDLLGWFSDADILRTGENYTVEIDCGDGSTSSGEAEGGLGLFSVGGSHTYSEEGWYRVAVKVFTDSMLPALVIPALVRAAPPVQSPFPVWDLAFRVDPTAAEPAIHFPISDAGGAEDKTIAGSKLLKQWWMGKNTAGTAGNIVAHTRPIAFVKGRKLVVSAVRFQVMDPALQGKQVKIRATVRGFSPGLPTVQLGSLPPTTATVRGGFVEADDTMTANFTFDKTRVYDTLAIEWEISTNNGTTWSTAGTTRNKAYVLFKDPAPAFIKRIRPTMAEIGSRAAMEWAARTGIEPQSDAAIINAVIEKFMKLEIKRADGQLLTYWKNWDAGTVKIPLDACEKLLQNGDGNCASWSNLFLDVLAAQGLDASGKLKQIHARNGGVAGALFVKGWGPKGEGKAIPLRLVNNFAGKLYNPNLPIDFPTQKSGAAKSQGYRSMLDSPPSNKKPWPALAVFNNHFVAEIRFGGNKVFFDASYGVLYPQTPELARVRALQQGAFAYVAEWEDGVRRLRTVGPNSPVLIDVVDARK